MVVNEITAGVSLKLYETFGSSYRIYQNDVSQGLFEPCFFLAVLSPSHKPYLGRRRKITVPLDVHFFPEDAGNNREMARVGDLLFSALEFITTTDGQDVVRGRDMSYEVQDSVLHFFVTYSVLLNETPQKEEMESLSLKERVTNTEKEEMDYDQKGNENRSSE